jgi:hypothetical protein
MTGIAAALGVMAAREPVTHFHAAPVSVEPAQVTVSAGATHVHLPDGLVTLEATVEAPAVSVNTPPAQVIVQQSPPVATRQRVVYGDNGDIAELIQEPTR